MLPTKLSELPAVAVLLVLLEESPELTILRKVGESILEKVEDACAERNLGNATLGKRVAPRSLTMTSPEPRVERIVMMFVKALATNSLFCASIVTKVLKMLLDRPNFAKLYLEVMLAKVSNRRRSWVVVLTKLNLVRPDWSSSKYALFPLRAAACVIALAMSTNSLIRFVEIVLFGLTFDNNIFLMVYRGILIVDWSTVSGAIERR